RTVEAEVWYPATTAAVAGIWDSARGGFPNAPPTPGRMPLVVFSHGLQGTEGEGVVLLYARMLRRLALEGFVVASADHPKDTDALFGDNLIDRPLDLKRVLDVLLDDARAPDVLRGHVDADRVGLLGHSFGGYTVFAVASNNPWATRDPRVKAVAGLAPGIVIQNDALATVRAPALIVSGALDTVTPPVPLHERPYAALGAPKYFVQYTNGDHFVYSDA